MSLKKIDEKILKSVEERQRKLNDLCESFGNNISKLEGMTNSPIILSMLASLGVLMEVLKDQIDFTRSGFDLFLSELESLDRQIQKYHRSMDDDGR